MDDSNRRNSKLEDEFGKPGSWELYEAAMEGVPRTE